MSDDEDTPDEETEDRDVVQMAKDLARAQDPTLSAWRPAGRHGLKAGHPGLPGAGHRKGYAAKGLASMIREEVDFRKITQMLVDIAIGRLAPAAKLSERMKAAELLMLRAYGAPTQTIDLKTDEHVTVHAGYTTAQLIAARETLRAVLNPTADGRAVLNPTAGHSAANGRLMVDAQSQEVPEANDDEGAPT